MQSVKLLKRFLLFAAVTLFLAATPAARATKASRRAGAGPRHAAATTLPDNTFDLRDYGATGDGVTDDGPALQSALDAVADAGGGTLLVPAGRYAILTPVYKDFNGLASAVTVQGVESSTPVPPPDSGGDVLTRGLDLTSEFLPRTGPQQRTLSVLSLQSFLIKDIAFVGTPDVETDALVTLALDGIEDATVRHCEFYGLSSQVESGGIVLAERSRLTIEQSAFLGSTANSGAYSPVVQNIEWKGITVAETVFADYGQRAELFSKTGLAAPFSWINVGNAAAVTNNSPRREVVVRSVFLDEGGFFGISSFPYFYEPESAPIDLFYVTGLHMNVSNLGTSGHYLEQIQSVLVEDSHYGWSHNADAAISLLRVGEAILARLDCVDGADRIRASEETGKLTVINSVYTYLDSLAQTTEVIPGAGADADPVLYVREQFAAALNRAPDAAAHFYWSNRILQCGDDAQCVADRRRELAAYLAASPHTTFSIKGRVTDESGAAEAGLTVTLSGSQSVATVTDGDGKYSFSGLPTSGVYTVVASKPLYTTTPLTFTTPADDCVGDMTTTLDHYTVGGRVADDSGNPLAGVAVVLSGSASATDTTDAAGNYFFDGLTAGGDYTVTPSETHHTFGPPSLVFNGLDSDQTADFTATVNRHTISGRVATAGGTAVAGVTMTLTGTQTGTATTDAAGDYSFADLPAGGVYTVAPSKQFYAFTAGSLTFNDLGSDQTANFTAVPAAFTISGRITVAGAGLGDVTVLLSGSYHTQTMTDSAGNYSFGVPAEGNYTVTPSKQHYTFTAGSLTFDNMVASQTANFAGTLNRHTVGGRVVSVNNTSMPGITVTLSGPQSATATTDDDGNYSFADLPAGGNYSVAPSRQHYTFAPQARSFNDLGSDQSANFAGTLVSYTISGRVAAGVVGLGGVTMTLAGSQAATATTDSDGAYSFDVPALGNYSVTPSEALYTFDPPGASFDNLGGSRVSDFGATPVRLVGFGAGGFGASEGAGVMQVNVTRAGDTSGEAEVAYSATDGTARQGKDLSTIIGTLRFAPGEASKTFNVFITDDAFAEGDETLQITLGDPSGATLGAQSTATLTINDNDAGAGATNPADDPRFFVRQHYRDFLNRDPDDAGLDFWTDRATNCGNADLLVCRINVSAAFFLSIEFQETGYFVHRLYEASYNRAPRRVEEFLLDTRAVGAGVVVGTTGWEQELAANKAAFARAFVARPAFVARYPLTQTPAEFVAALNANTGSSLTTAEAAEAAGEFGGAANTSDASARARALRRVAENPAFSRAQTNPAFVLMQYFGYLQRNPDDPDFRGQPDPNLDGYNFWLGRLNEFGGDYRKAEMVKAFISSIEYRERFGR